MTFYDHEVVTNLPDLPGYDSVVDDSPVCNQNLKFWTSKSTEVGSLISSVAGSLETCYNTGIQHTHAGESFSGVLSQAAKVFDLDEGTREPLLKFSDMMHRIECYRDMLLEQTKVLTFEPLQTLAKEYENAAELKTQLTKAQESMHLAWDKFSSCQHVANMQEPALLDRLAHNMLNCRKVYQDTLLKYVSKIREINTLKKVTFVEKILEHMLAQFSFFNFGYQVLKDMEDYMSNLFGEVHKQRVKYKDVVENEVQIQKSVENYITDQLQRDRQCFAELPPSILQSGSQAFTHSVSHVNTNAGKFFTRINDLFQSSSFGMSGKDKKARDSQFFASHKNKCRRRTGKNHIPREGIEPVPPQFHYMCSITSANKGQDQEWEVIDSSSNPSSPSSSISSPPTSSPSPPSESSLLPSTGDPLGVEEANNRELIQAAELAASLATVSPDDATFGRMCPEGAGEETPVGANLTNLRGEPEGMVSETSVGTVASVTMTTPTDEPTSQDMTRYLTTADIVESCEKTNRQESTRTLSVGSEDGSISNLPVPSSSEFADSKRGYLRIRQKSFPKNKWPLLYFIVDKSSGNLLAQGQDQHEYVVMENLLLCMVKPLELPDVERNYCFQLISPSSERVLQALTEKEMKEWIKAIQDASQEALRNSKAKLQSLVRQHTDNSGYTKKERKLVADASLKIRAIDGNRYCCDCSAPRPDWASINLGVIICIECSGVHRSMGVHVSKVRSITLDKWDEPTIEFMESKGNTNVNKIYEANLGDYPKPTRDSSKENRQAYIRLKYVEKQFAAPDVEDSLEPEKVLEFLKLDGSDEELLDESLEDVLSEDRNDSSPVCLVDDCKDCEAVPVKADTFGTSQLRMSETDDSKDLMVDEGAEHF